MASEGDETSDFYAVLGLNKECSADELKIAYRKLAKKWHPDRCSASGNPNHVEEAKKKFQSIQQAHSVLSDENKRFLYDIGVYDCDDDDDENGMGEFLNEMAAMMTQNKTNENGQETFEELQELFEEMCQSDIEAFAAASSSSSSSSRSATPSTACSTSAAYLASCCENHNVNNIKRHSSAMTPSSFKPSAGQFQGFCIGMEHLGGVGMGRRAGARTLVQLRAGAKVAVVNRRQGRKHKGFIYHLPTSIHNGGEL